MLSYFAQSEWANFLTECGRIHCSHVILHLRVFLSTLLQLINCKCMLSENYGVSACCLIPSSCVFSLSVCRAESAVWWDVEEKWWRHQGSCYETWCTNCAASDGYIQWCQSFVWLMFDCSLLLFTLWWNVGHLCISLSLTVSCVSRVHTPGKSLKVLKIFLISHGLEMLENCFKSQLAFHM